MDEKIAPQAIVTPQAQEKGIRDNADEVWQAFLFFRLICSCRYEFAACVASTAPEISRTMHLIDTFLCI